MAIIRYNLNDFDGARMAIRQARNFTDPERSSVVDYVDALLAFQAGDDSKAVNLLRGITEAETWLSSANGRELFSCDDIRYNGGIPKFHGGAVSCQQENSSPL